MVWIEGETLPGHAPGTLTRYDAVAQVEWSVLVVDVVCFVHGIIAPVCVNEARKSICGEEHRMRGWLDIRGGRWVIPTEREVVGSTITNGVEPWCWSDYWRTFLRFLLLQNALVTALSS